MVFGYKHQLLEQLKSEDNPATTLLLVVLILYAQVFGYALHAPGRAVQPLLELLKPHIPLDSHFKPLEEYQKLVIQYLKEGSHQEEDKLLKEKIQTIKQTANLKSSQSREQSEEK